MELTDRNKKMIELFGEGQGDCISCRHRVTLFKGTKRCKCAAYDISNNHETDWDYHFKACGLKHNPYPKDWDRPLLEQHRQRKPSKTVDGQITLFD